MLRHRPDWFWLALLCLAPAFLPETALSFLEYRRDAVLSGEVWRLLSGHFVHYSLRQAAQDGGAVVALAYALERVGGDRQLLPRLALIAIMLSFFLVVAIPEMARYRGASGLAMALAGMLLRALWQKHPPWRPGLIAASAVLCGKILADALGLGTDLVGLPQGILVAWQVHAAGLASGVMTERFSGRVSTRVSGCF